MKHLILIIITLSLIGCASTGNAPVAQALPAYAPLTIDATDSDPIKFSHLYNECVRVGADNKSWFTRLTTVLAGCRMGAKFALAMQCMEKFGSTNLSACLEVVEVKFIQALLE